MLTASEQILLDHANARKVAVKRELMLILRDRNREARDVIEVIGQFLALEEIARELGKHVPTGIREEVEAIPVEVGKIP